MQAGFIRCPCCQCLTTRAVDNQGADPSDALPSDGEINVYINLKNVVFSASKLISNFSRKVERFMLVFKDLSLPNGLVFRFTDHSVRYFGDFYRIAVEVECDIAISPSYFSDPDLFSKASGSLGDKVRYRRRLEQMGVPSPEKEKVAHNLIKNLIDNSHTYFSSSLFPEKVIISELNRKTKTRHIVSLHGDYDS